MGTVRFGNDHFAAITGYGDYVQGNLTICHVYYVEGLGHNLFSVGQFCDGDLEVAFRSNTCYVRNLKGDDMLTGSRDSNLYTISIFEMAASSLVCLMSRATSTKSWLWHRQLSHLNFGTINQLTSNDLVDGLPKYKYNKDHLCSACEQGKSKKASLPLKLVPSTESKLKLLRMDLCRPMRVASINGKKYILVIVDDYSWNLKAQILTIRTDNGTEFKNEKLRTFYAKLGIVHKTSIARTPQQNGVVERRNQTLIEAARTMLIFSIAPEFLWAEAIATACFTKNRSITWIICLVYEEYYTTSSQEVSDNSAANTLDNENTSSSSSIVVEQDDAPQIVSSPKDYALWEVIENGNSWVPIPVTTPESGPSTALKMTVPSTAKEKTCKKNDVKARSLLLMALPNEHQLTFDHSESLDSIFNRLQKLVSRLAILGVVTSPEDLNVKFLRSLPAEWDTHVVVWMNKPDFDTMGLDDLYNNFKIVEQKVKKYAGTSNDDKNLAFLTTSGASSTNNINTVKPEVSTATTKVNTASTEISTASFSDATIYAFLSTQPQGSQLVHEDLEQLHDDDLEEMDLKWNMALLSMRARKFYQRTGRKIIIDGSSTAGYDKSKVECFNCHKMGHFARECRAPRSKDNRNWNQGSSSKAVRIEDASEKAMCAIDGAGFDWSDMAEDEIQANMALMAFTDSEVSNDKSCSKSCLQNYEALKKQYDDLLVKLDDTGFKAATYKRGLSILEAQVVKYKESKVLFSEEIALLKRSVGHKEYLMGLLKTELEKVKEEKEGFEFKIAKFEKSSKDLGDLLASQVTDKSKKGFGYNDVHSPHPLILNRPTPLELSYSGLEEFKQPEVNEYGFRDSSLKPTTVCDRESDNSKENTDDSLKLQHKTVTVTSSVKSPLKVDKDWKEKFFCPANQVRKEEPKKSRENNDAPIIEDWVSDDEEEVEPIPKVEKKTVIHTATKKEFVKPEKPIRRSVRYAEMYRSQGPRGNQRNWNGQKSNQLGCNFVFNNKACFICGSFDHIQYSCPNAHKHMIPRAVLMKTGLKTVNNARPVNTVRSVNTGRPFSTARSFNTVRPSYTAHPKSIVLCARPRTHFQNQAQSTVQRPFYKKTALTKSSKNQNVITGRQTVNTGRQNVNTVRARGFNAVKPSACWVWRPIKPNGASLSNSQLNDKGFVDSGCSRHMSKAHLSDFQRL
ncbi:ribonuclease H-like domain-containing protein [Tanacetum coccineum]|uniref:Ribonuclease H-like domain-containing protein n=1 Tax=Tanacetum coccineum TaxID=301880 RepID=A0ABQ5GZ01_9ASTR